MRFLATLVTIGALMGQGKKTKYSMNENKFHCWLIAAHCVSKCYVSNSPDDATGASEPCEAESSDFCGPGNDLRYNLKAALEILVFGICLISR